MQQLSQFQPSLKKPALLKKYIGAVGAMDTAAGVVAGVVVVGSVIVILAGDIITAAHIATHTVAGNLSG